MKPEPLRAPGDLPTQRKLPSDDHEQALIASELRYRRLFETAKDGILILDAETGMIVDVNPFLIELLGFSRESFLGKKVWELGFFKDIVANEANFAELQAKEYVRYEDMPLETSDGRRIEVEFVSNVYLVDSRKVIQCNIRDITARKRVERLLRDSEDRLRFALDEIETGAWDLDLIDHTAYRSLKHDQIFGYETLLPQWTYEMFLEHVVPEDRAVVDQKFRQAMESKGDWQFECRIIRRGGEQRWILASGRHRLDSNGQPRRMSGIVQDITGRKRAEEEIRALNADLERRVQERTAELQRSEEKLAVTLRSIGDAVLATDTEGRVTRLNPVAEKLTGWTQTEAQGRPVTEVFHIINEQTRQPAVIPVDKVLATGEIHGLANHTVIIARDGTEWPIADSAAPIRDKDGKVLGVVLIFRDITEEKKAERASRESERQLRALNEELEQRVEKRAAELVIANKELLFQNEEKEKRAAELVIANKELLFQNEEKEKRAAELVIANKELVFQNEEKEKRAAEMRQAFTTLDASDDGALIFDAETLHFTYVNEGAVRQLGYTREELLKLTPLDIEQEFDEVKFRELLAPMLRGEVRTHRFITLHRHKDGHNIPVEINLQYVAPAGERPRFIAIARDITERLKTERLALRSQRLESIGTLAGGVAHDLNNALAPIMMGAALLKAKYPNESQIVDMFEASARRGADMVKQLLTFAKGAEGERVLIQPGHLIKELKQMMEGSFPKNIQLAVKCAPKLPLVRGDATQMHQVLLNLCVNARDAMPNGGTLTLEAENREVDAVYASSTPDAKPGKYLALRVRDTGTGIPPEIIDRIFDPFFTTKGPDKGTGLGLSTVMGIVKGHGGFLQVYSQPGKGSTFIAYLPVTDAKEEDAGLLDKVAVEFRGQGETILLVDDEPGIRAVAREVLRRLNFKPLTATDGADGLIQAAQHRTKLHAIITDLHMPYMDGMEFVRALRRVLPDTPIVVASGRLEETDKKEFETLGVTLHLAKPFTEAQLAEALKKVFQK
jgi:PAS domain S-box-containing protein